MGKKVPSPVLINIIYTKENILTRESKNYITCEDCHAYLKMWQYPELASLLVYLGVAQYI